MKAIVYRRYGSPDVLSYEDIDTPVPAAREVLLSVRAAALNPYDWHFMRGEPYFLRLLAGLRAPKSNRLGVDAAGTIEAVGADVTNFKPGDEVFGLCRGALAEHACARATAVAIKPEGVAWDHAAATPMAALTALQALRDGGRVAPGYDVLINGAAGGVGTLAVQIAKVLGATVTGVCSTRNTSMVQGIGADHAIDYTRENFTLRQHQYDVIVDCIGNHSLMQLKRALKPAGRCVAIGGPSGGWMIGTIASMLAAAALSKISRQKMIAMMTKPNAQDLALIAELMASRKITPVIDRTYSLPDAPDALRYLESGHARGKVIVSVQPSSRDTA